jgi:hypothetical protein
MRSDLDNHPSNGLPDSPVAVPPGGTQLLAIFLIGAILWFYLNGLLIHHLRAVNIVTGVTIFSVFAWILVLSRARSIKFPNVGRVELVVGLAVTCLFALPILLEPLTAWDARSIWFFHAKRVFFDDGLNLTRGWNNPEYSLMHPAYPKLLPLLAAEVAFVAGIWNEYLPKASLIVLLFPVVFGLLSLARGAWLSGAFLGLMFLLGPGEMVWTGYVDGYFALYSGIGVLFLSRWLDEPSSWNLIAGTLFLGVALNLKNEGALITICAGACFPVFVKLARTNDQCIASIRSAPVCFGLAVALPLATYIAWWMIRNRWGLSEDLLGGDSLGRALRRINDRDLTLIFWSLYGQGNFVISVGLLAASIIVAKLFRIRLTLATAYPVLGSVFYSLGLCAVYLATPHVLAWHLETSADRVMLVPVYGIIASAFLVLRRLESFASSSPQI